MPNVIKVPKRFGMSWVLAAALAASACSGQQHQIAMVSAHAAYDLLLAGYVQAGVDVVAQGKCGGYKVETCPALVKVRKDWSPVWAAYDAYATVVESSAPDSEIVVAYCNLVHAAPVRLPGAAQCVKAGCGPTGCPVPR